MKKFFFKPIDPNKTKPVNIKDLKLFENKLANLSKKIHKEKFISINKCLICNNKKLKKIFSSRNFKWVECFRCGHQQKRSMPKYEALLKFYNSDTVENYLSEVNINYRLKNLTIPKYNFIKKFIKKSSGKKWLDLASGLGDMPYLLKKKKNGTLHPLKFINLLLNLQKKN
jgi:Zn ribbon nucleic-acid-binding protein